MSQPILLAYHIPAKRISKIRVAAMRLGVRVRVVDTWEYLQPIGSFTGDCGSFEAMYDKASFPEEMLVLAHFPDALLNRFLQELRAAKVVVPLKCVLTESNKGWNALELHEELMAEHRAMQSGGEAAHPGSDKT